MTRAGTRPQRMAGRPLAPGEASGSALVLGEPLSLWGGLDPASGRIVDAHHPQRGERMAGRVVVMPSSRGSSSSSSILAEAVRAGTAPAAIVIGEPDLILAVGAAVAEELYGVRVPIVQLPPEALGRIREGQAVRVTAEGVVEVPASRDAGHASG